MRNYDSNSLVDEIYEAAVIPELWPPLLHRLSVIPDAVGGILFATDLQTTKWTASERIAPVLEKFIRDGWADRNQRPRRLAELNHAGFVGDLDVFTPDELDQDPVYTEFLRKNGVGWAAGTLFPMPSGDLLVFSFERRYELGPIEAEALTELNEFRPHMARAGLVSWRLGLERARAMADALESIGLPAAVLRQGGRISAANASFQKLMPEVVADHRDRLRFVESAVDSLFAESLERLKSAGQTGRLGKSFPLAASEDRPAMVFHLLPVCRAANDLFSQAAAVLVVMPVDRGMVPSADLLQGLFDLTPAEARVARAVGEGQSIEMMAVSFKVSRETLRSQLKSALGKIGLSRQADLAAMLAGVSLPKGGG